MIRCPNPPPRPVLISPPPLVGPVDPGRPGRLVAHFAMMGRPVSKKNTPVILFRGLGGKKMTDFFGQLQQLAVENRRSRIIQELARVRADFRIAIAPNRDYQKARGWAIPQLRAAWRRAGSPVLGTEDRPVMVGAIFFLPKGGRGDLEGFKEALADLLQESGWLGNDHWIVRWWQGTRRERDPANPRTEILIWHWLTNPAKEDQGCLTLNG